MRQAMQTKSGPLNRNMETMKQKLKTHKATAKRARITGGGKFMHLKSARTKYRRKKDPTRNRSLNQLNVMATGDAHKMKRLLPYAH